METITRACETEQNMKFYNKQYVPIYCNCRLMLH